jgi:hypothetical protein
LYRRIIEIASIARPSGFVLPGCAWWACGLSIRCCLTAHAAKVQESPVPTREDAASLKTGCSQEKNLMNKRLFARLVTLTAGAWLCMVAGSSGATMLTPGMACRSASASAIAQIAIAATPAGVSNVDSAVSRSVICPLARRSAVDGAYVTIEGTVNYGKPLTCTVYSHNYNGLQLASRSFVAPNSASTNLFDGYVSFGADEAPYYAALSAVCSLPPQGSGRIFSFSVSD